MFIELNNKQLLNLFWLDDVYQDPHDKTRIIYVMINGSKRIEVENSEEEATSRVTSIRNKLLSE